MHGARAATVAASAAPAALCCSPLGRQRSATAEAAAAAILSPAAASQATHLDWDRVLDGRLVDDAKGAVADDVFILEDPFCRIRRSRLRAFARRREGGWELIRRWQEGRQRQGRTAAAAACGVHSRALQALGSGPARLRPLDMEECKSCEQQLISSPLQPAFRLRLRTNSHACHPLGYTAGVTAGTGARGHPRFLADAVGAARLRPAWGQDFLPLCRICVQQQRRFGRVLLPPTS